MALVVGCSGDDEGTTRRPGGNTSSSGGPDDPGGPQTPGPTGTASAAVTACEAVAAPKQLSDAKAAGELRIAGTGVFFRSGTNVERILKDGNGKKTVFTSPNLVRMFADRKGLLLVEQTNEGNPNAILRGYAANQIEDDGDPETPPPPEPAFPEFPVAEGEDPGGTTAATNFNAISATVFGADAKSYYALAEDNNGGNAILIAIDRTALTQTTIVSTDKEIKNPILANNTIFWVEDTQRIKKITLATEEQPQGQATEIFGLGDCNLAVSESLAYCSVGATIETRDLEGKNAKTVFGVDKSKSTSPFGVAEFFGDKLYVRSASPDAEVQHFIRSIAPDGSDESFVACKRTAIRDLTSDGTDVVWADDTGVFMVAKK
ncbi:MAG: hypothetical protein KIT84_40185 [Labilithrix sp.]|nr:hypothetical protein [Labilithrix sp.]